MIAKGMWLISCPMLRVPRPLKGWCSCLLEQVERQQGASWPGRQRGKRTVWLPNEPLKQIDPDCLWFQMPLGTWHAVHLSM